MTTDRPRQAATGVAIKQSLTQVSLHSERVWPKIICATSETSSSTNSTRSMVATKVHLPWFCQRVVTFLRTAALEAHMFPTINTAR